jgi:hypothetical protein
MMVSPSRKRVLVVIEGRPKRFALLVMVESRFTFLFREVFVSQFSSSPDFFETVTSGSYTQASDSGRWAQNPYHRAQAYYRTKRTDRNGGIQRLVSLRITRVGRRAERSWIGMAVRAYQRVSIEFVITVDTLHGLILVFGQQTGVFQYRPCGPYVPIAIDADKGIVAFGVPCRDVGSEPFAGRICLDRTSPAICRLPGCPLECPRNAPECTGSHQDRTRIAPGSHQARHEARESAVMRGGRHMCNRWLWRRFAVHR